MVFSFRVDELKMPAFASRLAKQGRYAAKLTLNETATSLKEEVVKDLAYGFDRPTAWALKGIYAKYSRDGSDSAYVGVNDLYTNKQGRAQFNTLSPHFSGGERKTKAFETALRRVQILPYGWFAVAGSGADAAGALDAYGNIKASFIVQMISYFQAFGEQGYRANMTDKRKKKIAGISRDGAGYKQIGGFVYFVSYGRRGRPGGDKWVHGRHDQHLAPGIWGKRGIHGCEVVPIIMFVRSVSYRKRFDLDARAQEAVQDLDERYKRNLARAMETAR